VVGTRLEVEQHATLAFRQSSMHDAGVLPDCRAGFKQALVLSGESY
jgi:hypothetical protein